MRHLLGFFIINLSIGLLLVCITLTIRTTYNSTILEQEAKETLQKQGNMERLRCQDYVYYGEYLGIEESGVAIFKDLEHNKIVLFSFNSCDVTVKPKN